MSATETVLSDQEERAMRCMEEVRQSGACNMLDGPCVSEASWSFCAPDISLFIEERVERRRKYGSLLGMFGSWKSRVEG